MIQSLWDAEKAVLRENFIAIKFYLKKQEKSQVSNLTISLNELEKEEQTKPKVSRRREIIKIRVEINEIETKKTIGKINKGFPGGALAGDTIGCLPMLGTWVCSLVWEDPTCRGATKPLCHNY